MKQRATVVREGDALMARVVRPEACDACRACRYGQQAEHLVPLPEGDYREGDEVDLELTDGKVGRASLLAYGVPLAFLLLGLGVASALGAPEWGQALGALLATGVGWGALKLLEPVLKRSGAFRPAARPCDARNEDKPDSANR